MAPLFWFLFIGLILGLSIGGFKHEDWLDRIADVEMGLLGSMIGGMVFILTGNHFNDTVGAGAVAVVTALLFLGLLKRVIYREPKLHHR